MAPMTLIHPSIGTVKQKYSRTWPRWTDNPKTANAVEDVKSRALNFYR